MVRRAISAAAFVVALLGTAFALPASPVDAWAWDPHVTLQGVSVCRSVKTTWVWVEASNGEHGWATNGTGRYSFRFNKAGTGGINVRVNFGNGNNRCTTTFGVNRPTTGTSATRNVIQIY